MSEAASVCSMQTSAYDFAQSTQDESEMHSQEQILPSALGASWLRPSEVSPHSAFTQRSSRSLCILFLFLRRVIIEYICTRTIYNVRFCIWQIAPPFNVCRTRPGRRGQPSDKDLDARHLMTYSSKDIAARHSAANICYIVMLTRDGVSDAHGPFAPFFFQTVHTDRPPYYPYKLGSRSVWMVRRKKAETLSLALLITIDIDHYTSHMNGCSACAETDPGHLEII
eukprot:5286476-Pleurochrysis_carterae.AAC.2